MSYRSIIQRSSLSHLPRVAKPTTRFITLTATRFDAQKPLSQGHATSKANSPGGRLDVQSKSVQSGKDRAAHPSSSGAPHDTASPNAQFSQAKKDAEAEAGTSKQAAQSGSFKDHRGNAQTTESTSGGSVGKSEEAAAPSLFATAKAAVGMGTSKAEHKESKTAPRASKSFHTSAWLGRPVEKAVKSKDARKPVDTKVQGDQNPHLKHKPAGAKDSGKGNAASTPHLPSQKNKFSARHFHSSHKAARSSPPGYVAATESEPKKAGYDAAAEAHPSGSLYDKPPPARENLTPSSEMAYASTSADKLNETMRQAALDGKLAERNPPPSGEVGRMGMDEAWKIRNNELKTK